MELRWALVSLRQPDIWRSFLTVSVLNCNFSFPNSLCWWVSKHFPKQALSNHPGSVLGNINVTFIRGGKWLKKSKGKFTKDLVGIWCQLPWMPDAQVFDLICAVRAPQKQLAPSKGSKICFASQAWMITDQSATFTQLHLSPPGTLSWAAVCL